MLKKISIIIFLTVIITACTLFKKGISKPVIIKFSNTTLTPSVNGPGAFTKYINHSTPQEYADAFFEGFSGEASTTKNVNYDNNSEKPDFILKVKDRKSTRLNSSH